LTVKEPIVGVPVILKDGRVVCYSCAQDHDWADEVETWMPADAENYPVECEECGQVLIHESQRGPS
jgi:hypothetical protein